MERDRGGTGLGVLGASRSASSIIRWASIGIGLRSTICSTMLGPNVRLGTKWLSITSTWTLSAVEILSSSVPMLMKSALRMLGWMYWPSVE